MLAVDSQGRVYVTFVQSDGSEYHIYLCRYDGSDVKIWDNDASTWTDTFANGDPIDRGVAQDASSPQLCIDSQDSVYVTFFQSDGSNSHVYLSRYDGSDVKIWDNGASAWTDTFSDGDPIDRGVAQNAVSPQVAVDSQDRVYVTLIQSDGSNNHVYLSRFDGSDVKIWDNGASTWTDTFTNGDPVDVGVAQDASSPQVAVDSQDRVYVTLIQSDGSNNHVYLSRFDGSDV